MSVSFMSLQVELPLCGQRGRWHEMSLEVQFSLGVSLLTAAGAIAESCWEESYSNLGTVLRHGLGSHE